MRIQAAIVVFAYCAHVVAPSCSPQEMTTGCKIVGNVCSCGYGCPSEFIFRTRRACSDSMKERSSNICNSLPCMRGNCLQTQQDPGYLCKCEGTGYYGQRCEKACPTAPVRGLVFPHESSLLTLRTVEAPEKRMERAGSADTSASYLQVVVKKHGGVRGARLPSSSSPEPRQPDRVCRPPICQCAAAYGAGLDRGYATLHSCVAHHNKQIDISYNCDMAGAGDAEGGSAAQPANAHPKKYGNKPSRAFWTQLTQTKELDGPDRIEVYQFGAAAVVARRSETRVERCARPLGRRLAALFDELLAVPRLLLPLPILVILRVQSCVLLSARDVLSEAARSVSELALTPALVTLQDALRPPLLCVARVNAALRDALRPLWLILGDATEPLANLLAQIRLVQVRNCASVRDV